MNEINKVYKVDESKITQFRRVGRRQIFIGFAILFVLPLIAINTSLEKDFLLLFNIIMIITYLVLCYLSMRFGRRFEYTSIEIKDGYIKGQALGMIAGKFKLDELGWIMKGSTGTNLYRKGTSPFANPESESFTGSPNRIFIPIAIEDYDELIAFLKEKKRETKEQRRRKKKRK